MANKISNSLITLSSAAILAVYAAGYQRTSSSLDRFENHPAGRTIVVPPVPEAIPPDPAPPKAVAEVPSVSPAPAREKAAIVEQPGITVPEIQNPEPSALPPPMETAAPIDEPAAPPPEPPAAAVERQVAAAPPAAPAPQAEYKDGTYLGWGYSRHGDIQAFVKIQDGRIVAAGIEKCRTRYSCSVIDHAPSQVVARQGAHVDYVSGATQSVDAFSDGIAEALSQAK